MPDYHHIAAEDLAVLSVDFLDLDNPHISRDHARQNRVGILGDESGMPFPLESFICVAWSIVNYP